MVGAGTDRATERAIDALEAGGHKTLVGRFALVADAEAGPEKGTGGEPRQQVDFAVADSREIVKKEDTATRHQGPPPGEQEQAPTQGP